jgi:plasmid stabilization system protein ParE
VKVRYTLRAAAELEAALAYIAEHSPQGARHVMLRLRAIIELLAQHPHAGRLTTKGSLRRIVAYPYPYLIYYRATRTEIIIHGVRHSSRRRTATFD